MREDRVHLSAALIAFGALGVVGAAAAREIAGGEGVVREMRTRYENSWFHTMRFTQRSTTFNADGTTKVETWHEAALLPGRLRIDIGSPNDGKTVLLADGKAFGFEKGKPVAIRPRSDCAARRGLR